MLFGIYPFFTLYAGLAIPIILLTQEFLCGMKDTVLIHLQGICKSFDGETVLDNIDLNIHDKEFITLLGPSGCGKTTTLRIIGGFETPDEGEVFFDGKKINDLPPYKRQVNTVFQRYALFPHLNVYENIAFGLRVKKMKDADIREKVKEMLRDLKNRGYFVTILSSGNINRLFSQIKNVDLHLIGNYGFQIGDIVNGTLIQTKNDKLNIFNDKKVLREKLNWGIDPRA